MRRSQGITASGESAGFLFLMPDLQGIDPFREQRRQRQKRGHPASRVDRIPGGN